MKINYEVRIEDRSKEAMDRIQKSFERVMWRMEANAKRFAPVDTGRLRGAINLTKMSPTHFILRDGVEYGQYVEYGTNPHKIVPKDKKVLRFETDDGVVFTKRVQHPGTVPQPFFRPAYRIAKKELEFI